MTQDNSLKNTAQYRQWFAINDIYKLNDINDLRKYINQLLDKSKQTLSSLYEQGHDIEPLVRGLSWLIDEVLKHTWQTLITDSETISLIAVGGYGREEMLPGSDIDLLILLDKKETPKQAGELEAFLTLLWDIGLQVGHSVRTLAECQSESRADLTVVTNLQEARFLAGNLAQFEQLVEAIDPDTLWPVDKYFAAKLQEQLARHERYNDAVANLEPNVKEGPGGLRDIHMIGWVVKRHFGSNTLEELVLHGFLTNDEFETLINGQRLLWKVRFGLHHLAGRREDRLLFNYQRSLATLMGYQDSEHKQAVELFMKDYYLTTMEMSRLNEMLLQLFKEAILYPEKRQASPINRRFQSRRNYLEAIDENVFKDDPVALLEVFVLMAKHPELTGVSAGTIRLIREHTYLIDDNFRNDSRAKNLFIELFRQPHGLTHELRRMNRYGILAAYYPAFSLIAGQMQYDLFHVYTVDEHTLFVIRNLRRFTLPEFADEFPLCSEISTSITKPELLYLAGFFHDIAKGRGGDHSTLGATEAKEFLASHGFASKEQTLVSWLVESHLLMSQTAQSKDINDPEVINEFAAIIGNTRKLDYLYLLTVADICGTNPTLWNSWKDSLLRQLYLSTRRTLRLGVENSPRKKELIHLCQQSAMQKLSKNGIAKQASLSVWLTLPDSYFLRHTADEIAWHTQVIVDGGNLDAAQIAIQYEQISGSHVIFLYTPVIDGLFNRTMAVLEKLRVTITDARIITSEDNFAINTYHILDNDNQPINDPELIKRITHELSTALNDSDWQADELLIPVSRRMRHFSMETHISFDYDEITNTTRMKLITSDQPGLLSLTAQTLYKCNALMKNAKIATFGAHVEDFFYLTDSNAQPLSKDQQACIRSNLSDWLEDKEGV
ncbi:MAG: [protein-PII] uridylyltransferase [Gammaproteobacteria bacterium]